MLNRLVIRNVGPIRSVDINLNKVNVFIGPQGCGKSTIAKIVSFCSWLEKVNQATGRAVADGLVKRLVGFHHMEGYFSEKSSILFVGDNVAFAYNWEGTLSLPKKFVDASPESLHDKEIVLYAQNKVVNPKVAYIPAERSFVSAVPTLKKYSEGNDNLQSFVNDWFAAKRHYTKECPMPMSYLGVDYYYNKENDRDYLKIGSSVDVPLTSASSGVQSIVPLALLVKWLSSGLYEENKPFSPEENQRVREILSHLSGGTGESEAELVDRLRGFIQERLYTHTQFIVEEPEQNVFPKPQIDLVYHLISEINHGRNHRLLMTTHSPYVLYALNNCLLAYLVKDQLDEATATSLDCVKNAINPADVSVWSFKDGFVRDDKGTPHKTIQDARGLIRKNCFNDVMKDVMREFNTLLSFLE